MVKTRRRAVRAALLGVIGLVMAGATGQAIAQSATDEVTGWLRWRGPLQSGVSLERNLPDTIDGAAPLWTFDRRGRGAPVIAGERVYCMAYEGEGADLQESIVCLDATTGRVQWEHAFSDFLSDIIYNRYAISSPTIDPATGNVICMTTPGLLNCFSADGDLLWQKAMMEQFGRFTYPNGRTLGPLLDQGMVIFHTMTSSWGPQGPARDRFFAFDAATGDHVWTSTPGGPPKDSPYSHPVFEWRDGKRLLYAGTAGGNMVCVDVHTGEPVWRYQMSIGGVCASPVLYGDQLIGVHGKENIDSSSAGRMISLRLGATPAEDGQRVLDASWEAWRNDSISAFTSSPVLVGNRVYSTIFTGELWCVDADSGRSLWHHKLAPDQIHASPAYGDGKLYVPMNNGSLHVIRPTDEGPKILSQTQLEGNCLGAPSLCRGRVYVHTTEKLYCFGVPSGAPSPTGPVEKAPRPGTAVALQILPADVLVRPGERVRLRARSIDANGLVVSDAVDGLQWAGGPVGPSFSEDGAVADTSGMAPVAMVLKGQSGGLSGTVRFRVVYPDAFVEDFEAIDLGMADSEGTAVARPPSHWIGGWPKWDVREVDGSNVLAKTIENPLFQRAMGFIGHPDSSDYTMQVDVMSDGNRRLMSNAGVVNQRYLIALKANHRELEISSNDERVKHAVPYRMTPKVWYTLKTRVDLADDGSATVRAKAWPRDEPEPTEWTAEFTHRHGHTHGAPGIFGFALQSRYRVYLDNLSVVPNGAN